MSTLIVKEVTDTTKLFNVKRGAKTSYSTGLKIFSMKPVYGFIVENGELKESEDTLALAEVDANGNKLGGDNLLNLTALSSEPDGVIVNPDGSVTPIKKEQEKFGKTLADKMPAKATTPQVVAAIVAAATASNQNAGAQTDFIALRLEVTKYSYLKGYKAGKPDTTTQKHVVVKSAQFLPTPASPTSI